MTRKQLRAELMETRVKIRAAHEALKVLRTRHAELKAWLTEARADKNVNGETP